MNIKIFFAISSTIIGFIAFVPYLKDVISKKTEPHVFTWLIWLITHGTAAAALWHGGGGPGIIPLLASLTLSLLILFLSLRTGSKNITLSDIIVLIIALFAIFIWWGLDNPVLAVLIASAIDVIGYIPTFRKSYAKPWTETTWAWGVFALADGSALLALESYNLLTMSYLTAITSANLALFVFLILRHRAVKNSA